MVKKYLFRFIGLGEELLLLTSVNEPQNSVRIGPYMYVTSRLLHLKKHHQIL